MTFQTPNWVFTINNPAATDKPEGWEGVRWVIYQRERGAGGTEHIQGYVSMKKKQSMAAMKKLHKRAHWEPRRGSHAEAKAYCMKDDTAIAGSRVEWGEEPKHGLERMGASSGQERWRAVKRKLDEGGSVKEVQDEDAELGIKYEGALKRYKSAVTGKRSHKTEVTVLWGVTGSGKSKWCAENYPDAYWKPKGEWWDGMSIKYTKKLANTIKNTRVRKSL